MKVSKSEGVLPKGRRTWKWSPTVKKLRARVATLQFNLKEEQVQHDQDMQGASKALMEEDGRRRELEQALRVVCGLIKRKEAF